MAVRTWTHEEFILALDLYFRISFGSIHKNNPDIIKLSELIGRTPSSVAMRLSNYAANDPELQARGIKGLVGGGNACLKYWNDYSQNRGKLLAEAAICRLRLLNNPLAENYHVTEWDNLVDEMYNLPFQTMVQNNYKGKCAVTGIEIPQILVGTHILPVSENESESNNPANGILLSLNYAKAFVDGLIGFSPDYHIYISDALRAHQFDTGYAAMFKRYEKATLHVGEVIAKPDPRFLEWHMDTVFNSIAV